MGPGRSIFYGIVCYDVLGDGLFDIWIPKKTHLLQVAEWLKGEMGKIWHSG